jgi:hypothetical protein
MEKIQKFNRSSLYFTPGRSLRPGNMILYKLPNLINE